MNLKAFRYSSETPIFGRQCKNKSEAKRAVLNNGYLSLVDFIVFKGKRYSITDIYKWGRK